MPKLSPIPRLSVLVPVGHNLAAFENTLVSVLENRPLGCEVLVAHDGSYDDPFDLSDEVRFVVGSSPRLIDLVGDAASEARGRFVHVLADGVLATEGWTAAALEKFEHHDAGIVAPVIRHQASGRVLAAGWRDTAGRLCHPVAAGRECVERRDIGSVDGAYLQASFWRRELLRTLTDTLRTSDPTEAVYAHTWVARSAGWRTVMASECELSYQGPRLDWDRSTLARGQRLRAIQTLTRPASGGAMGSALKALVHNCFRPSRFAEAIGQATASLAIHGLRKRLDVESVSSLESDFVATLRMPERETIPLPLRRAA